MLNRALLHSFRSSSSSAETAITAMLTKVLEQEVLEKPMHFTVEGMNIKTTLKDGVLVSIFPGMEDKKTVVAVSKNGVTVERELKECWLQNWFTTRINTPAPAKPKNN